MSKRIVVADDDPDIRRLIVFALKRRGHTILEAENGEVALQLIRQEQPDLAVLDVMMPGLTGLEVADTLSRELVPMLPILLLSAKGQASEIRDGLSSGAQGYVVKPFSPQDLVARVEEMLAEQA